MGGVQTEVTGADNIEMDMRDAVQLLIPFVKNMELRRQTLVGDSLFTICVFFFTLFGWYLYFERAPFASTILFGVISCLLLMMGFKVTYSFVAIKHILSTLHFSVERLGSERDLRAFNAKVALVKDHYYLVSGEDVPDQAAPKKQIDEIGDLLQAKLGISDSNKRKN